MIAVWDPTSRSVRFYRQPALAFGASASVVAFNWVACALCSCLLVLLEVAASNFYDDYTVVEFAPLAADTAQVTEAFFELLGWDLKELPAFSAAPEPLGCVVDLSKCREGTCIIKNRASRVADITGAISELLEKGAAEPIVMRKLRGRLVHARAQTFGRFGGMALRALALVADRPSGRRELPDECVRALSLFSDFLKHGPPRQIRALHVDAPLLFTDGACEESGSNGRLVVGVGAVLFLASPRRVLWLGCNVPDALVDTWQSEGSKQVIAQGELLPILMARRLWADHLRGRSIMTFVDNDAARAAMIRGYSANRHSAAVVDQVARQDIFEGTLVWYERVPSQSNPADAPSRGEVPEVIKGWPPPVRAEVPGSVYKGLAG